LLDLQSAAIGLTKKLISGSLRFLRFHSALRGGVARPPLAF